MKKTVFILLLLIITHVFFLKMTHWQLPVTFIQKPLQITGFINTIPKKKLHGWQFVFHAQQIQQQTINANFLIAWYQHPPALQVGQQWQLTVKLKPLIGLHNPNGFDYAAFLMHKGISATGYVVTHAHNSLLKNKSNDFIDIFREKLQTHIFAIIGDPALAAFTTALCVGLRDGLTENDWQIFQKTGTNHLVAIAGLHIGFVTASVYCLVNFLWRLLPALLLKIPASRAAEIAALIAALSYSALSGFAIPAQRASIMLIFLMGMKFAYRSMSVWKRLFYAALIVLIINPYDFLDASFWLSFSAISVLAWVMSGRIKTPQGIRAWIRMQSAMVFGILPFTLLFFQQTSLIAFFANAIAIPWIGFVILPVCLCAMIFSIMHFWLISQHIFWLIGKLLWPLWQFLTIMAGLPQSSWCHAIPTVWILLASIIGVIFLLAPRGLPAKWLGCFGLLPLFFYHAPHPKKGDYWVTVIDVGQGLSVLVQTAHHILLYDAGAHYPNGFDMGASVVAPLLREKSISIIDRLEISHGDNDHSGGAAAIEKEFRVRAFFSSAPKVVTQFQGHYCIAGQSWIWDNVHFTTLNPASNTPYADNNSSCVIQVNSPSGSVLLTGDIEADTEYALVAHYGNQLHATVLIVPHHGSRTSSTEAFINAVSPQYAIISAGKYNRYHLPAAVVLSRYAAHHAKVYVTAEDGAISIRFLKGGQVKLLR